MLPMYHDSQHLHSFLTQHKITQPTRTARGGCKSLKNFQEYVESSLQELCKNRLSWIDDLALHSETEAVLLDI